MKKLNAQRTGTRVVFQCRLSYVHLDEPRKSSEDSEPKYSAVAIIAKEDTQTLEALRGAIAEAYEVGRVKLKWPETVRMNSSTFKYPLKDGDTYEDSNGVVAKDKDPVYAGTYFLNMSSKEGVPCLNLMKEKIDAREVYSGCYALASVNFFAFDKQSKGVACGLNAVLKLAEGERLGGVGNPERDFDAFDLTPDTTDLSDF